MIKLAWLIIRFKFNVNVLLLAGAIEVSELDGSFRRTLVTGGIEKPSSIVVDPSEG